MEAVWHLEVDFKVKPLTLNSCQPVQGCMLAEGPFISKELRHET